MRIPPIITVFDNALDLTQFTPHVVDSGTEIFGWLQKEYPDGFGTPIRLILNGERLEVEESDVPLSDGDKLAVVAVPAAFVVPYLIAAVIGAIASLAATFIVSLIFGKPRKPSNQNQAPDPVYGLSGAANSARLGDPIPVGYGKFITYPDYACQPYAYFKDNNQFIAQVLCIGQGEYEIEDVLIADTPSKIIEFGTVAWTQFEPYSGNSHLETIGNIETKAGFECLETVVTSIEVSDIELSGDAGQITSQSVFLICDIRQPNQLIPKGIVPAGVGPNTLVYIYGQPHAVQSVAPGLITVFGVISTPNADNVQVAFIISSGSSGAAGPFSANKPNTLATEVHLDFVFPNGLYGVNTSNGAFINTTFSAEATIQPIDDNGQASGAPIVRTFTYTKKTNTPQRITERITGLPAARYSVKVRRVTAAPANNQTVNNFIWTGLKARLALQNVGKVYGRTTLIAVSMKATGGISSDAANKIRVKCTRKLAPFNTGAAVPDRSVVQAFNDILTNRVYGAGLNPESVDQAYLGQLQTYHGNDGMFDGIINVKSTVWEALQLVSQTAAAIPALSGAKITMIQDGVKSIPVHAFNPANIVAGSLEVSYNFDRQSDSDGIQIEYRSETDFSQKYVVFPPNAVSPENVTLFGCTRQDIAQWHAVLLWDRRQYQRVKMVFTTEMEGLLPQIGDRILIHSEIMNWGDAGEVIEYIPDSLELLLDRNVDWTKYGANIILLLRGETGNIQQLAVTKGASDRRVKLAAPLGLPIRAAPRSMHGTLWALGGSVVNRSRDAIVNRIVPQGNSVSIECVNYDNGIYNNALPFMRGDVP